MTMEAVQARPVPACTSQPALPIPPSGFMGATTGVVQAVQANSYCPRVSLFSEWKGRRRDYNKKTPVPPVPTAPASTKTVVSAKSGTSELVPASPILDAFMVILSIEVDALYTGRLTGKVPMGWTRDGWVIATRDRLKRTHDPVGRRRLKAELRSVEGEVEASRGGYGGQKW